MQLGKIVASSEESHSFWQRRDYKAFGPNTDWDNVDWDAGEAAGRGDRGGWEGGVEWGVRGLTCDHTLHIASKGCAPCTMLRGQGHRQPRAAAGCSPRTLQQCGYPPSPRSQPPPSRPCPSPPRSVSPLWAL